MKNLLLVLCLFAPTLSMASYLFNPGTYQKGNKQVIIENLADGETQSIKILNSGKILLDSKLSERLFYVTKFKTGFFSSSSCRAVGSTVVPMGPMINATCNASSRELINMKIDHNNDGSLNILLTHLEGGLVGDYEVESSYSLKNLPLK